MFFSKAFGVTASEFFEKSIDKHKIDAILNSTVRFGRCISVRGRAGVLRILSGICGTTEPIQNQASHPGSFCLTGGTAAVSGISSCVGGVCSLKSVE